jgi:hypothetical protein
MIAFEPYRLLEPSEAEVAAVVRRVRARSRARRRSILVLALAACLLGGVAAPGRAALAAAGERLDAFLAGGPAPGAAASPSAFMADFAAAAPGTGRVLATAPDGEQLVALRATMHGQPYACFDYGHHYGECDPIGLSPDLFAHDPIALVVGTSSRIAGQDVLWALTSDEVASVQLVYADGTAEPRQPVANGVALLFDPARTATTLVAYGANGDRVGSVAVGDQNLRG